VSGWGQKVLILAIGFPQLRQNLVPAMAAPPTTGVPSGSAAGATFFSESIIAWSIATPAPRPAPAPAAPPLHFCRQLEWIVQLRIVCIGPSRRPHSCRSLTKRNGTTPYHVTPSLCCFMRVASARMHGCTRQRLHSSRRCASIYRSRHRSCCSQR
jgi:hypothetical protein